MKILNQALEHFGLAKSAVEPPAQPIQQAKSVEPAGDYERFLEIFADISGRVGAAKEQQRKI